MLTAQLSYWIHTIPTTLAAVESSAEALQPLKKSDDRSNAPFEHEEKIQAAFRQATAVQSETSARTTTITSSWRRTLRYWLAIRGKLGGILRGIHLCLLYLAFEWIQDKAERAASRQLETLNTTQSLPWYIPVKIAVNTPKAFIRIVFSLLAIPLVVTWTWHILSWHTSSFHSRSRWPSLRQLMSVRGIWFLIRSMPLPILPSKRVLWHMLLPTLIWSVAQQIGTFYPDSMIHTLFVTVNGANARPNVLVAAAILAESTATSFLFYILPRLLSELVTRVQASLLPEDVQPIVPMDRAFGLKPKQGQHQGITMIEAWKTMSWDTLWRIVKMQIKTLVLYWSILTPAAIFIGIGQVVVTEVQQHHSQRLEL
jgi:hypothetical protein